MAPQTYQESNGFTNTSTFGTTVDGEWDFSLIDNGAPSGTTYCLRAVGADGSIFSLYNFYPTITTYTAATGPTTDQEMRGGQWFNSGTKQPFYWAQ